MKNKVVYNHIFDQYGNEIGNDSIELAPYTNADFLEYKYVQLKLKATDYLQWCYMLDKDSPEVEQEVNKIKAEIEVKVVKNINNYLLVTNSTKQNYKDWLHYASYINGFNQIELSLIDENRFREIQQRPLATTTSDNTPNVEDSFIRAKEVFRQKVMDSDWYNTCPSIRKPFIWLGSIRELAIELSGEQGGSGLLEYRLNKNNEEVYIADVADRLFTKESTGKPITHEQLYNAAKQAKDDDNKIKFSVPKKHK